MGWGLSLNKTKQKKSQRPHEILLCSYTSEEQKAVTVSGKIRIIHISFIALFSSLPLSILWVLVQCFFQSLFFSLRLDYHMWDCICFTWQGFSSGLDCSADICENIPEAFLISNKANSNWLQMDFPKLSLFCP